MFLRYNLGLCSKKGLETLVCVMLFPVAEMMQCVIEIHTWNKQGCDGHHALWPQLLPPASPERPQIGKPSIKDQPYVFKPSRVTCEGHATVQMVINWVEWSSWNMDHVKINCQQSTVYDGQWWESRGQRGQKVTYIARSSMRGSLTTHTVQ